MKIWGMLVSGVMIIGVASAYVDTRGSVFENLAMMRHGYTDLTINGQDQFQVRVIKQSSNALVVVKIFAQQSMQSLLLRKPYYALANELKPQLGEKLVCLEMDLFGGGNENYEVIMQCMSSQGIQSMALPVFLFFKRGSLCEVIANQADPLQSVRACIATHCV